jgi:HAE1 family hydrophobic/amphiphilic exporter-1
MNIAKFAVTRPVAVTMQIAALVLLGVICLTRLPVELLPKVTLPTISVSTTWPNVAPEEIEAQVTRPIEQALSSTPGLYQVSSTSSAGSSRVTVQFNWGTDLGQAALDVIQRLERAKRGFPNDDALQDPTVQKFDPNQLPILVYAVHGETDLVKLRTILDNQITPMLESADGVASVTVSGGQPRAIIVNVDPVKLRAHGLALPDIMRRLLQENVNVPAGIARQGETEYTIRSLGWLNSLDELRALPLTAPNAQVVTLGEVAAVQDASQETRTFTRLSVPGQQIVGLPAVNISVSKQADANTLTTAKAIEAKMASVRKMYPDIGYVKTYDQARFVKHSVDDLKLNALIGGVLAVLILLFFLRNIRSTLVVALSIPISILSTFALVYLCGFTLNTMSLSGLALATGLIVDDAVVVLENIFRHMERDKRTPREAAIQGTNEILSAVIASTWTVMVVFLPLLFIKGQAGQMFLQFALVIIFSLAVSLLDAVTIVPMLATRLISGEAHAELSAAGHDHPSLMMRIFVRWGQWFTAMDEAYRRGLQWALRHRLTVLVGALTITLAAFGLFPKIGFEMMPPTDSGDLNVSYKLPPGTSLAKTNQVMLQLEEIVRGNPNVEVAFASVGRGGFGGGGGASSASQGSISIHLKETNREDTKTVVDDLQRQLMVIPGIRPRVNAQDIVSRLMTGGDQSIEIDIFGNDMATLSRLSKEVMGNIRDVPGLMNPDVNWQDSMPEVQWQVDRVKAAQLGVTFSDIASTLNTATNGSTATYFQERGFQYPIIVQMPEADRKTIQAMSNLVIAAGGRQVPLGQVAHPVIANGPNQITRLDRQRFIAVGSPLIPGTATSDVQQAITARMKAVTFPPGYYWAWGTSQQRQAEEFSGLGLAIWLAIGLIFMLLAAQFESLTHPLAILLSVPLAGAGVLLALFLTERTFCLTSIIGMLMLVGIVVKNGILLVDYTNTLRKRGMQRDDAVLTASPTRLRPILMTASAAILGMLPIALALGKGSEIQAPMATAVIGGLATSTILTLFVVPVVYTLLDDITGRGKATVVPAENAEDDAPVVEPV